jgi:hypothetical protein
MFGADNRSSQLPPQLPQSAQLLGTLELVRSRNHLRTVLAGDIGQDLWMVDHAFSLEGEMGATAFVGERRPRLTAARLRLPLRAIRLGLSLETNQQFPGVAACRPAMPLNRWVTYGADLLEFGFDACPVLGIDWAPAS